MVSKACWLGPEHLETVGTAVAEALVKLSVEQEETIGRLWHVWNLHIVFSSSTDSLGTASAAAVTSFPMFGSQLTSHANHRTCMCPGMHK